MANNIQVQLVKSSSKEVLWTKSFNIAQKAPLEIQAVGQTTVRLTDSNSKLGPKKLITKRVGKDLHIMVEGNTDGQPDIIIKDYYSDQMVMDVQGQVADGQWVSYVPADGSSLVLGQLGDADALALVLPSDGSSAALWAILGGLGAVGGVAAVSSSGSNGGGGSGGNNGGGNNGGGNNQDPSAAPNKPGLKDVIDNAGVGAEYPKDLYDETNPPGSLQTADSTPTFKGTGVPGNIIEFMVDGVKVGETTVKSDGTWEYTLPPQLPGNYDVSMVQVDNEGNRSQPEVIVVDIVDALPLVPSVQISGVNRIGDVVDNDTFTVNGSGRAGEEITVKIGTQEFTTTVQADGTWSVAIPSGSLPVDNFTNPLEMQVTVRNPISGVERVVPKTSLPVDGLIIDRSGPDLHNIQINTISVAQENTPGAFQTSDNNLNVYGSINGPLQTYEYIEISTDGGVNWQIVPTPDFNYNNTDSQYHFVLKNIFMGLTSGDNKQIDLRVNNDFANPRPGASTPTQASPHAPTIADPALGQDHADINVVAPSDPGSPYLPGLLDDNNSLVINDGGTTTDDTPIVSGIGNPGDIVNVYIDGAKVGEATVQGDGSWSFPVGEFNPVPGVFTPNANNRPLADGPHDVAVTWTTGSGTTRPSESHNFEVDSAPPTQTPTVTGMTDDTGVKGDWTTSDQTPSFKGNLGGQGLDPNQRLEISLDGGSTWITVPNIDPNGNWKFTPPLDLPLGNNDIQLKVVDTKGREGPVTQLPVVIVPPEPAPTITDIVNDNGLTDIPRTSDNRLADDTPLVKGTGVPGDIVEVWVDGTKVGEGLVDRDGNWTVSVPSLPDGNHTVNVVAQKPDGTHSAPSAPEVVVVDTTGDPINLGDLRIKDDVAPQLDNNVLDNTFAGNATNDNRPEISGKANPGSEVTVVVVDQDGIRPDIILKTQAGPDGNWSITPSTPLPDGDYSLEITQKDDLGNEGPPTIVDLTIDTAASVPQLGGVIDDVPLGTGPVISGGSSNDNRPTIQGQGEPGGNVDIVIDGTVVGTAPVGPDGSWSFTVPPGAELSDGSHTVVVNQTDSAGNKSGNSPGFTWNVDTSAPSTVQFDVYDDTPDLTNVPGASPGTNGVGNLDNAVPNIPTNDKRPDLKGHGGEPGTTIVIYADRGDGMGPVALNPNSPIVVQPDGTWTYQLPALPDGPYVLSAIATDAAGNSSNPVGSEFDLVINAGLTAPSNIEVSDSVHGNITSDTTPVLSGQGRPGDTVFLQMKDPAGIPIGPEISTTVAPDGTWSFDLGAEGITLPPTTDFDQPYLMDFKSKNIWGQEVDIPDLPLIVDTSAPSLGFAITGISADTGVSDTDFNTTDRSLIFYGTLNAPLEKHEHLEIFIQGGWRLISAEDIVPNGDGTYSWSYDNSNFPFGEASIQPSIRVRDDFGRTFPSSPADLTANITPNGPIITFVTPSASVSAPTIAIIEDNTNPASPIGIVKETITKDNTPVVTGTAQPGETVVVYLDGKKVAEVTANGSGVWSYTPSTPLTDGAHEFSATVKDAGGVESAPSEPYRLGVDATAPVAKAGIDTIGVDTGTPGDFRTTDNTPHIFGKLDKPLQPDEKVMVQIDGGAWVPATVYPDGSWMLESGVLTNGNHVINTQVVDQFGRTGPSSQETITIENAANSTASITSVTADKSADTKTAANGDLYINDNTPLVTGLGTPGEQVNIYVNGERVGSTNVYPDGTWDFVLPYAPDGEYVLSVTSGTLGSESRASNDSTYWIDTSGPTTVVNMSNISVDSGAAGNRRTGDHTIAMYGKLSAELDANEKLYIRVTQKSSFTPGDNTLQLDTNWVEITNIDDLENWLIHLSDELGYAFDFGDYTNGAAGHNKPQFDIQFKVEDIFGRSLESGQDKMALVDPTRTSDPSFVGANVGTVQVVDDLGNPIDISQATTDNTITLRGLLDFSEQDPTSRANINGITVVVHILGQPQISVIADPITGVWELTLPPLTKGTYDIAYTVLTTTSSGTGSYESLPSDGINVTITNPQPVKPVAAMVLSLEEASITGAEDQLVDILPMSFAQADLPTLVYEAPVTALSSASLLEPTAAVAEPTIDLADLLTFATEDMSLAVFDSTAPASVDGAQTSVDVTLATETSTAAALDVVVVSELVVPVEPISTLEQQLAMNSQIF